MSAPCKQTPPNTDQIIWNLKFCRNGQTFQREPVSSKVTNFWKSFFLYAKTTVVHWQAWGEGSRSAVAGLWLCRCSLINSNVFTSIPLCLSGRTSTPKKWGRTRRWRRRPAGRWANVRGERTHQLRAWGKKSNKKKKKTEKERNENELKVTWNDSIDVVILNILYHHINGDTGCI